MMNDQDRQSPTPRNRLTLLAFLVGFVFLVLLISFVVSSGVLLILHHMGFMQPLDGNQLPVLLLFLLITSLFVGLALSFLVGRVTLRPLKRFIEATRMIAAGDFTVRVPTRGPEEYSRLAVSFNEMARELGSLETLRDDFVSDISHEYKTPIASIRGFAKLLKRDNLTKGQRQEYLDIIIAESDRLSKLSGNVLMLSKLNSVDKPGDMEDFQLDEQLRRVIVLINPQIEKKRIELEIELAPCRVTSNRELLEQVWINLIQNAVKFTGQAGHIRVEMKSDADLVRVAVQDDGIGMEPEVLKRIFDKFYQGDASRSGEGNGLGLALVQRIVTLYGGRVEVHSALGQGSTFTVILPLQRPLQLHTAADDHHVF